TVLKTDAQCNCEAFKALSLP
nr:RecName: Full=Non-specific lipid-transfer protein-like protein; AltName: Full=Xylogen-like protein [Jatropha curcas]